MINPQGLADPNMARMHIVIAGELTGEWAMAVRASDFYALTDVSAV